ncbi:MAG: HEAT repeat domain-containing protein [Candidatus Tectomicrobia bacterium]|nr:HEAT repeat domain-containing protein [Candidatus Tectomicrobia bacterium]
MEPNDRQLGRLVSLVESLRERIDALSARLAPEEERRSAVLSPQDYRELLETRVRRGVLGSTLRVALWILVLLALGIGMGGWFLMDRTIGREVGSIERRLREKEIPQAVREFVGGRLDAVVQDKAKELTESFRSEINRARWELAERYLSSNSRLQQIQGLHVLRESGDPRTVDRVLRFMREKGALDPLSLDLRRLNLDYGVQALLAQGSEAAQSALRQVIADPGYAASVRADAMRAASLLQDRKALPAFRAALRDSDREVRLAAVEAVVALDARETWPYLAEMLAEGKDPRDYPAVIDALTKLKVAQAAQAVLEVVQRTTKNPADLPAHEKTHAEAVAYFRSLKVKEALSALFDFLMHPDLEIRLRAVAAIRELTGASLGTLEEWKTKDADWRVAKAAEWQRLSAPRAPEGTPAPALAPAPAAPAPSSP